MSGLIYKCVWSNHFEFDYSILNYVIIFQWHLVFIDIKFDMFFLPFKVFQFCVFLKGCHFLNSMTRWDMERSKVKQHNVQEGHVERLELSTSLVLWLVSWLLEGEHSSTKVQNLGEIWTYISSRSWHLGKGNIDQEDNG